MNHLLNLWPILYININTIKLRTFLNKVCPVDLTLRPV